MKKTNIDYWEMVLKKPTDSYRELFEKEVMFLKKRIKPHSKILDIGCGDGRIISEIKDYSSDIIGLDSNRRSIENLRKRFVDENKIKIIEGNAFDLPFEYRKFDYVLLMMTLVNFSVNKLKALFEMRRVLKDSGSMIISVYSDSAFDERKKMYEKIGVPINEINETTFIFDKSVGSNESEQFSMKELKDLCILVDLRIVNYIETKIGLICEIKKTTPNKDQGTYFSL